MAQIAIDKRSSGWWTATFSNPPINLIDSDTIGELQHLIATLESDPDVKVVVFRSADPDFFLAHWDVLTDKAKVAAMPPGPTGLHPWGDVLVRLSRAPVSSIAEIRGRARGAGSEFALSCDMRFASRKACAGRRQGPDERSDFAARYGVPASAVSFLCVHSSPWYASARSLADQARTATPFRYRNASRPSGSGISGGVTAMMTAGELSR